MLVFGGDEQFVSRDGGKFGMIGRLAAAMVLSALAGGGTAFAQGRGEWVRCAEEGGYCRTPYPTVVRYGSRGTFTERRADRGIGCNNGVFGDPLYGVVKSCYYLARRDGGNGWGGPPPPPPSGQGRWQTCASEHEFCGFRGLAQVRYGVEGRWVIVTVNDGIKCDNQTFGRDPAYGIFKKCQYRR